MYTIVISGKRSGRSEYARAAFTLLEMLVVIAIIAVLGALLMGVLSSSKRKAQQATCLSNLRQLGMATIAFAQDNEGMIPFAWDRQNMDASQNNFFAQLKPILYSETFDGYFDFEQGVFACPTRLDEGPGGSNPFRVSYGMNASNTVTATGGRRLSQVPKPAQTLLIADIHYAFNHVAISRLDAEQVGFKHGGKASILFFDGHVTLQSEEDAADIILGF